jgi:hypothetical protein
MTLGRGALAREGVLVFEGMERVTRAVPMDDREADGPDNLRAEVEEDRWDG